ncbi:MAG: Protein of unknown function transrane [Proteobacteria bacterium]|nr:Protein of unknown function transrane [Pseudomonadota bacterium]
MPSRNLLATLAPGLFVFLWSTGFIGAKFGLPYAEPLTFMVIRFAVVIVMMLFLAWSMRAPWPRDGSQWLRIGVSGLLVHATYLGGVYEAIVQGLPVGVISLVVGLQPLLTAVGAALLLGESISRRQWMGFALGLGGIALVLSGRIQSGFGIAGLPAAVTALFGITAGTLYQKRFCPHFDYRSGAVLQFVPAALITLLGVVAFEDFRVEWNPSFLFALGWLTLVLSLGAVSLLNYLIRSGTATNMASLFYMVPPCTALIAWLIFDERLSGAALIGMPLVVGGVYLVRK